MKRKGMQFILQCGCLWISGATGIKVANVGQTEADTVLIIQ